MPVLTPDQHRQIERKTEMNDATRIGSSLNAIHRYATVNVTETIIEYDKEFFLKFAQLPEKDFEQALIDKYHQLAPGYAGVSDQVLMDGGVDKIKGAMKDVLYQRLARAIRPLGTQMFQDAAQCMRQCAQDPAKARDYLLSLAPERDFNNLSEDDQEDLLASIGVDSDDRWAVISLLNGIEDGREEAAMALFENRFQTTAKKLESFAKRMRSDPDINPIVVCPDLAKNFVDRMKPGSFCKQALVQKLDQEEGLRKAEAITGVIAKTAFSVVTTLSGNVWLSFAVSTVMSGHGMYQANEKAELLGMLRTGGVLDDDKYLKQKSLADWQFALGATSLVAAPVSAAIGGDAGTGLSLGLTGVSAVTDGYSILKD
jgi:hypothetical protein